MAWISTSVLFYAYSKLYILTELSANDVKITSVDRQKLDLLKYLTYSTINSIFVEIQPDSTNIKNDPRISKANAHPLIDTSETFSEILDPPIQSMLHRKPDFNCSSDFCRICMQSYKSYLCLIR